MSEQRCGTCRWFADHPHELEAGTGKEYHQCLFPLPFFIQEFYTHEDLGRHCRTYEEII